MNKNLTKLDVKSASKLFEAKIEVCPLKDTIMIIDIDNYRISSTDDFISEHVYFNKRQYSFNNDSKLYFKCLFDADQMIMGITKIYDHLDPNKLKEHRYFGIFLFQGKYYDRLTDRMVFRQIIDEYDSNSEFRGLESLHFANNIFENNHYFLLNFKNSNSEMIQLSYRINSRFPKPYIEFNPESLGSDLVKYRMNGNKISCEYKIETGYKGKEFLLKKVKLNFGINEKLNIIPLRELEFNEKDLEYKEFILEDYYAIKGNVYRIIMAGKNGWRLQPRMMLTNFKFFEPQEEGKPQLKV